MKNSQCRQSYTFLKFKPREKVQQLWSNALADLGGVPGARPPPHGTQFFHFRIHFCQKVPVSEVHAPPNGSTPPPPTENPGSATAMISKHKYEEAQYIHPNTIKRQYHQKRFHTSPSKSNVNSHDINDIGLTTATDPTG